MAIVIVPCWKICQGDIPLTSARGEPMVVANNLLFMGWTWMNINTYIYIYIYINTYINIYSCIVTYRQPLLLVIVLLFLHKLSPTLSLCWCWISKASIQLYSLLPSVADTVLGLGVDPFSDKPTRWCSPSYKWLYKPIEYIIDRFTIDPYDKC